MILVVMERKVLRKDTVDGQWRELPELPGKQKWSNPSVGAVTVGTTRRLAVAVGAKPGAEDTVFVLNEDSQAWETAPPLKNKRAWHATINLGEG